MAKILCFGDSNTWGTTPYSQPRYNENERWTALLQTALIDSHEIIEAGQANRTLINNPPFSGSKSGIQYLQPLLALHSPDLIIIMLGTNDLKYKFDLLPQHIALGASNLIEQVHLFNKENQTDAKVLLLCPPPIYEVGSYTKIYKSGHKKSKALAQAYLAVSQKLNCEFYDVGEVVQACKKEGVHWPVKQHKKLTIALIPIIHKVLPLI